MKRIDIISYPEFKLKMLEVQQELQKGNIRNDWKDLRRAVTHPFRRKSKTPDNNHPSR
jgi:hypothetical protein